MTEAVREKANLHAEFQEKTPTMEFDDVILGRRSIRGYKPDPVPQELIRRSALAIRAPSSTKIPSHGDFYVITGARWIASAGQHQSAILAGVPHSRGFEPVSHSMGCIANAELALPSSVQRHRNRAR